MINTFFIDSTYVKQNTPVNDNVDENTSLWPSIRQAQVEYIKPILCVNLYDKLIADIDGGTLAGDYLTLVNDYVKPAHAYYTLSHFIPSLTTQLRAGGLVKPSSDNVTQANDADIRRIRSSINSSASTYGITLREYLKNNKSLYPEYETCCDKGKLTNKDVWDRFMMI